mgnify:FL=1
MHSNLSDNISNTWLHSLIIKIRINHALYHNNGPLEIVESFKYLGVEIASNHRWNECATTT